MDEKALFQVKKDFQQVIALPEVHSILIFGSKATGESHSRSDTDICIVSPGVKDKALLLQKTWGIVSGKYDLWLFEELPLYMQIEIIQHHEILFSKDVPEVFEYFYFFQKRWHYQSYRQKWGFEA